jgi:hypothetical protein
MGRLNGKLGIRKIKDHPKTGELFELQYEDPEKVHQSGYSHGSKFLNEDQLCAALTSVGATEMDLERILTEARVTYSK